MNEESEYKTALCNALKKEGTYARRIEDEFSVGFPDMIIIPPAAKIFFVEAKVVRAKFFDPSPRQYVELMRLSKSAHCVACLLGFMGGELYLHTITQRATLGGSTKKKDDETLTQFFNRFYKEKCDVR